MGKSQNKKRNHEAEFRIKKLEMYLQVDNNLSKSESLLRREKS